MFEKNKNKNKNNTTTRKQCFKKLFSKAHHSVQQERAEQAEHSSIVERLDILGSLSLLSNTLHERRTSRLIRLHDLQHCSRHAETIRWWFLLRFLRVWGRSIREIRWWSNNRNVERKWRTTKRTQWTDELIKTTNLKEEKKISFVSLFFFFLFVFSFLFLRFSLFFAEETTGPTFSSNSADFFLKFQDFAPVCRPLGFFLFSFFFFFQNFISLICESFCVVITLETGR